MQKADLVQGATHYLLMPGKRGRVLWVGAVNPMRPWIIHCYVGKHPELILGNSNSLYYAWSLGRPTVYG